jgi:hypothetical protein
MCNMGKRKLSEKERNAKDTRDAVGGGLIFVGFIGIVGYCAFTSGSEERDQAEAFFAALRNDRLDDAYAMLDPGRRAALSREEFEVLVDLPVLRQHTRVGLGNVRDWGEPFGRREACTSGAIRFEDTDWFTEVYLVRSERGEPYRVHTWATEPPKRMQSRLIDRCPLKS